MALFMAVLGVAVAMVLSVSFLNATVTSSSIAQNVTRQAEARAIAESGMSIALEYIKRNDDWRTVQNNGQWASNHAFGYGAFAIDAVDADGDLTDNNSEPLALTVTSTVGGVTYAAKSTLHTTKRLLMIVDDPANLPIEDVAKKQLFVGWGWRVKYLAASAPQSAYDLAVQNAEAAYVVYGVNAADVGTKLSLASIGVISENPELIDEMGLSTSGTSSGGGNLVHVNATHEVTVPLNAGSIMLSSGSPTLNLFLQPLGAGVTVLATENTSGEATMIAVQAGNQLAVTFIISGGQVIPQVPFNARATVIGSAITTSGQPRAVTLRLRAGAATAEPFGGFLDPVGGNVNDGQNPRDYIFPGTFAAGTAMSVTGQSWELDLSGSHITVDSNVNSPYVLTLRDGDTVPDIQGFQNQASVEDFLDPYIDTSTDTVTLAPNEAIYLFELGTTNLGHPAADFQDLVVLLSLGSSSGSTASANRIFLPWGPGNFNPTTLTPDAVQMLQDALEWARDDEIGGYVLHWDEQI